MQGERGCNEVLVRRSSASASKQLRCLVFVIKLVLKSPRVRLTYRRKTLETLAQDLREVLGRCQRTHAKAYRWR